MNVTEHLLTCLGEEGSEIAQDVSKCNRFGLDDRNVLNPTGPTNRERLIDELNDLLGVAHLLVCNGIISKDWMDVQKQANKITKVKKFMDYAMANGSLTPNNPD